MTLGGLYTSGKLQETDPSDGFDTENMLPAEPKDINAKSDNDMLAGVIADPRLPERPKGGSTDHSDERRGPAEED